MKLSNSQFDTDVLYGKDYIKKKTRDSRKLTMEMDEHISMKKNNEVSNTLAEIVSVDKQVKIDYTFDDRNTELNIVIGKDAIIINN